ncbi:MAG: ABC transporter permease [Candidatus Abyssobacteria bacterium SURF_5]|uniref:ABC transporter permease n=1 Tax=Abyssobacteria bacterium (strain SURF_5) TaxID=2093360 RepID=A0A3A4N6C6_ABYX5|nr:MAG: ABC transporter permease [Candidatus Abyssubacteria bacterium SURF_5]
MDLAVYDLKIHKGRFVATVLGVGLLFTIVLAMNGIYRGVIFEGLAFIRVTNPDLWVVERYRGGPFNEQSTLPQYYHYRVGATPGVEKASPLIFYVVERVINGRSRRFSIVGYDVFGGLGGPKKIYAGRSIQQAHYEMVAHPKLGVSLGDKIRLGLHTYIVVGLAKEAISPDGEPLVYLSLPDAQEVLYQKDNEEVRAQRERLLQTLSKQTYLSPAQSQKLVPLLQADTHIINAILVRLQPGADRDQVAQYIKKWLYLSAFSTQEESQLMMKGRLGTMKKQLFLFRTLLMIVSVVIISLVVYTFTTEKIQSIAVMKLIGAPNFVIARLVMEQSLLLTASSFLFGLIVIQNTYTLFPRTILRVPSDDVITFAIALIGGIFASILGLWRAIRTEPARALGG